MSVVPDLVPWLWDVIVKSRVLELVIYMLGCLVVFLLFLRCSLLRFVIRMNEVCYVVPRKGGLMLSACLLVGRWTRSYDVRRKRRETVRIQIIAGILNAKRRRH